MSTYLLQKGRVTEDAVTGMLVDLLRGWPDPEILFAVLGEPSASPHEEICPFPYFTKVTIEAWPRLKFSEPDVLLCFRRDDMVVARIIIEIKLGASKSGEDADAPPAQIETTNDQLAKYQHLALELWPETPLTVVYLTHHPRRPEKDIEDSRNRMTTPPGQGRAPLLVWRSWRDVEGRLRNLIECRKDHAFRVYAGGLAEVLWSEGMFRFRGSWQPRTGARGLETLEAPLWWKPGTSARHPTRAHDRYRWQPSDAPALPPCPTYLLQPAQYHWRPAGAVTPGSVTSFYRRP